MCYFIEQYDAVHILYLTSEGIFVVLKYLFNNVLIRSQISADMCCGTSLQISMPAMNLHLLTV